MISPLPTHDPLELSITAARLFGLRGDAEILLDESDDPSTLRFSKLSGVNEWLIEVDFGDATAVIVSCNWQGISFTARGEYRACIQSHSEIIPYVKRWLKRTLLRGILRDNNFLDCPHLEISGRSA